MPTSTHQTVLFVDSEDYPYIDDLQYEQSIASDVAQLIYVNGISKVTDQQLENSDVVVIYYGNVLTQEHIKKLKHCKGIVAATTGFDHIDIKTASLKRIPVCNIPDYGDEDIADHTMMLLLALVRKLPSVLKDVQKGNYNWHAALGSMRLRGRNLGIIGLGKIGEAVAKRALSFGLNVLYYDPYVHENFNNQLRKLETLEELLKQVDILSIHCPLNEDSKNLLNKNTLSFLKKGAVVINTSRGKIIDERSLITMLDPQELSLGLDVLANESSIPTELLKNERVILTPHSGFYTTAGLERMRYLAITSALNFLKGKENLNCIVNR